MLPPAWHPTLERRGAARVFFGAAQKFQKGPMGRAIGVPGWYHPVTGCFNLSAATSKWKTPGKTPMKSWNDRCIAAIASRGLETLVIYMTPGNPSQTHGKISTMVHCCRELSETMLHRILQSLLGWSKGLLLLILGSRWVRKIENFPKMDPVWSSQKDSSHLQSGFYP